MSWYSDGEPFDEHEPKKCESCKREVSYEICRACDRRDAEEEAKARGECCESCFFWEYDFVNETYHCRNAESEWLGEETESEDWCDGWSK